MGWPYVWDPEGRAALLLNHETLVTGSVSVDHWEAQLRDLVERHAAETGSRRAADLLQRWEESVGAFVQVCPREMVSRLPAPLGLEAEAMPAGVKRGAGWGDPPLSPAAVVMRSPGLPTTPPEDPAMPRLLPAALAAAALAAPLALPAPSLAVPVTYEYNGKPLNQLAGLLCRRGSGRGPASPSR